MLAACIALAACKKKDENTCKPEDETFSMIRLVVQPTPEINLDPDGMPRPTTMRVYQLKGGRTLDVPLDFRQVWQDAATAFGDELLKEEEVTVYPDRPQVFEIEPDEEATHVVTAAIFREPTGNSWYAEWETPKFHGDSVCQAKRKGQTYEDPCFLVFMEGSQIDGGHKPPPGMDADLISIACPPPPLKVKPAPPPSKKKKRKRGKLKDKAADAQDKAADGQDKAAGAQDGADKAAGAKDTATTKPEAPSVPGKD
ncbi:MAG: type VI secretion system lipoprotein TssJ [Deltaproteobacteria bacterium]|nr:type VI secretion system lipoprotein TssJ [Deltaproteobacteria bacterium]